MMADWLMQEMFAMIGWAAGKGQVASPTRVSMGFQLLGFEWVLVHFFHSWVSLDVGLEKRRARKAHA